jgi:nucleoside-diphosphate-sugar epimerase
MKILVTGGAGFIGYYLSKFLAEDKKNEIHIIDNLFKDNADENFKALIKKPNVTFDQLDLIIPKSYSQLDEDFDQIYHLAAIVGVKNVSEKPVLTLKVNTLSTLFLLDYISNLAKPPKLLFSSSCENYAGSIKHNIAEIPTPENVPLCIEDIENPRWTYASSKILGEIACLQYAKKYNFNTTIVRFHNVYGPRMGTQHVIPEFILRLLKNPDKFIMYGGYQYRSFCFVQDAVKMTINLMNDQKANNQVVNIGNDHYLQIADIAKKLFFLMNISPEIVENGAPEGSVNERKPDLRLIKELGDFVSEISFDEGLKETFKWYN